VLAARKIPHQLRHTGNGWWVSVPAAAESQARHEIARYERENFGWPPHIPAVHNPEQSLLPVFSVLLILATFHNLTLIDPAVLGLPSIDWIKLGSAHAGKILHGEWWRTVTALTLHADYLHLVSNLVMAAILLPRLCRAYGSGRAWLLVLLSGILGNWLNAYFQPYHHQAIGSSTALFGAVGIFAGAGFKRRMPRLKRSLLPLFAGLALLAMIGSGGERTDLGAHLFGFLAGLAIGFVSPGHFLHSHRKTRPMGTHISTVIAIVIPLVAWGFALGSEYYSR